jgi:glutaredoxin
MGRLFPWLGWLLMFPAAIAAGATAPERGAYGRPVLQVFVREGCPHCAAAEEFLPTLARARPDLRVILRSLDEDPAARADLIRYSREAGVWPPGVPSFVIDGRMLVGFDSAERTGPELVAFVDRRAARTEQIETKWFGRLSVSRLGLPLFTVALGLLDGFNPCAMWVLLFLLSVLVHLRDRRRMTLIAGTFVLASGAVYYAFMAAWLNVFLVLGMSTALRAALGAVALLIGAVNLRDCLRRRPAYSLSIPDTAKPGLYARMRTVMRADTLVVSLAGVALLALVVNFVELLCTAGFPAIYTAVLTQHGLSAAAHYAYLGLYNLAYIADDALMVTLAVLFLSSPRLSMGAGRWLKLLSGTVMTGLGVVMLLCPEWLL